MTQTSTKKTTRAERLVMPLAREVVRDLAVEHGACIRPVQLRRTDVATGAIEQVLVPCGHTLASMCPACAERARMLRAAQCREGGHLETEPVIQPDEATEDQKWWIEKRAEAQVMRDQAADDGHDTGGLEELTAELDGEVTDAGIRGNAFPARPGAPAPHHPAPPRCCPAAAPEDRGPHRRQAPCQDRLPPRSQNPTWEAGPTRPQ